MATSQLLTYLLLWGLIGCGLFFILVVVLFRTGIVYTARKEDGTLKEKIPLSGKLAMTIVPITFITLQVAANYFGLAQPGISLNYWPLFLVNYGLYLILFLFDTFFIDGFVIATWRPAFLQLPDAMNKESMQKHILISLPVGLIAGAVMTLVSTAISYFWWFN